MEKKEILIVPKYKKSTKKILEITEGYKSIKRLRIDVSGYTVLIGQNASGKTNILEWIYNEQGGYIDCEELIKQVSKEFFWVFDRKKSEYKLSANYKYRVSGINNLNFFLEFLNENEDYQIKGIKSTVVIPVKTDFVIYEDREKRNDEFEKDYIEYFDSSIKSNNFFTLLFSFPKYNMNNLEEIVDDYLRKLLEVEILSTGNYNRTVYRILSILPEINYKINYILREKLNLKKDERDLKVNLQLDTEENDENIMIKKFKIFVLDEAEGTVFPLKNKSAGLNNIMSVVIIVEFLKYLITKYERYNTLNFLIAIDEPELHLHPYIQTKLTEYLYETTSNEFKNKINIIVATHSQNMLCLEALEKVYIVDYVKDKGTIAIKLLDYKISDCNDINILKPIEDALGSTFNEFERPMLIVEGEEEVTLFRKVDGIFNRFSNIKCIKGKTNIAPYLIMINQYKDKQDGSSIILLDADVEAKDIKSVENSKKVLEGLKDKMFFIGKKIYAYDEYLGENTCLKKKGRFGETLEDFLIEKVLGKEKYEEIVNEIVVEYGLQKLTNVGDSFFELRDSKLVEYLEQNKDIVDELIKTKIGKEISELELSEYKKCKNKLKDLVFNKIKGKINSEVQSKENYEKFNEKIKEAFNWQ